MNLLFICTGNICRSPMAEIYFTHRCREHGLNDIESTSAGVAAVAGETMSENSRAVLKREGIEIPLGADCSWPVDHGLINDADLIIIMSWRHEQILAQDFPQAAGKVRKLLSFVGEAKDVSDPFGGTEEEYQQCFECMKPALEKLLEYVAEIAD